MPRPERGVCRYCKCDDLHACVVAAMDLLSGDWTTQGCSWMDKGHTVCSSPACVKQAHRDGLLGGRSMPFGDFSKRTAA